METPAAISEAVQQVLTVFKQLDQSGGGDVLAEDVSRVLQMIDPEQWSKESVAELFATYGTKPDGTLAVEPFVTWIFSGCPAAPAPAPMAVPVHATHQFSSTLVDATAQSVYEMIRPLHFKWLSTVTSAREDEEVKDVFNVAYSDNTVQTIQLTEYSDLDLEVGWEVVMSDPPVHCASQMHTIRCLRITDTQSCCVTWNTEFSKDATLEVIHDCKWKKEDAFESLKRMFPDRR